MPLNCGAGDNSWKCFGLQGITWVLKKALHSRSDNSIVWSEPKILSFCFTLLIIILVAKLRSHGLQPTRLHCPWGFPGKNTGVNCHFLLQRIFLTQGSCPCLLHWQAGSLPLSHQENLLLSLALVFYLQVSLKLQNVWNSRHHSWTQAKKQEDEK